ncbi:MAG: lipopolysaccharide core heptose(I) kinase RfaP [Lentisphaeria bacterium]|nr:lipopolysaccharide core heptose(I) kinase RfaP [Lentisphaeria bacterium]
MEHVELYPPFSRVWSQKDAFVQALATDGEVFRNIKNRKTMRFSVESAFYFIKIHRATGWGEILKNLLMFKKPVLGAENEYNAIRLLEKLGISTMEIAAYGTRGTNPAKRESFLVTKEITGKVPLEDFCADWAENPPEFSLRIRIIRELAEIIAKMHFNGMNHRDCYLCHFWLDNAALANDKVRLTVIDLHRAAIRKQIPRRLQIKDLAGILFSSMDAGISKRDMLRFAAVYRSFTKEDLNLWKPVFRAAEKLYQKEWKKPHPPIC